MTLLSMHVNKDDLRISGGFNLVIKILSNELAEYNNDSNDGNNSYSNDNGDASSWNLEHVKTCKRREKKERN